MNIKQMSLVAWVVTLIFGTFYSVLLYGIAQFIFEVFADNCSAPVAIIAGVVMSVGMLLIYALSFRLGGDRVPDLPLKSLLSSTLKGFGICAAYFVVVVGVLFALGVYRVNSIGISFMDILLWLSFFLLIAVGEEMIFRGFLFRWIDRRFGFVAALVVSAFIFGLVHWSQGDFLSAMAIAVEMGILVGAAYRYSGDLWLPIGMHWGWNFTQGNIFGFSVSGTDAGPSLIKPTLEGPQWLTGGAFGAEATVVATIIGLGLGLWFTMQVIRRQRQQPAPTGTATAES